MGDTQVRKAAQFRPEIPDLAYWKRLINCQHACPVHTDARGYVRAIAAGQHERAYLIARGPNPLASICGRVCGAPCEDACRRGDIDRPISIRALKRFVCGSFGPEAGQNTGRSLIEFLKAAAGKTSGLPCRDSEELLPMLQAILRGDIQPVEGPTVGIVGSGPAGLAAAHDLALLGFGVTIYEVEPMLGGMLAVGIPEYRLPRDLIAAEVEVIQALGVEAVTGCEVGHDVSLPELRQRHDAVVIAVGLKRSRKLELPGADAPGVLGGVEFLRDVSVGNPPVLGRRVVVIGGGNVAYDVGRSALRQVSSDAARTAMREGGVSEVHLCSLESLAEMPADDIEIREGEEEGIQRHNGWAPLAFETGPDGKLEAVRLKRCLRVFDDDHRFAPVFDEDEPLRIECDSALLSIGQSVELAFVDPERDGVAVSERGTIDCDSETGRTAAKDLYVAGDLATGPSLLIHAVASGKRVARAVYETVTGRTCSAQDTELHLSLADYQREVGYEAVGRVQVPVRDVAERMRSRFVEVERGYDESLARREASRCLDCGVNTIFDGERCILCGGCQDVCPELCYRIVSADRIIAEGELAGVMERSLGDLPVQQASAILKDETRCIRCALCAERCPTGAITMERLHFQEVYACRMEPIG